MLIWHMRLFIAVAMSEENKDGLFKIQEQLRNKCLRGNFTRRGNFHITMAFLGEVQEEKLGTLFCIMEKIKFSPFEITFDRAGFFTHSRKELWWIGPDPNSPALPLLEAIHLQLMNQLSDAGFNVDKRPFNTHITMAREIRRQQPIVLDCPEIIVMVDRLRLMKSDHLGGLLTYTELK